MSVQEWFEAVQTGQNDFIIDNLTSFVRQKNQDGNTALMLAAGSKNCGLVNTLKDHEYGLKNLTGQTALMLAAIQGCVHCVQALVQYESGHMTHQGRTALMLAFRRANVDAARVLLPYELHLFNAKQDEKPEVYLEQAIEKLTDEQQAKDATQLLEEVQELRRQPIYDYVQTINKRLDGIEIVTYQLKNQLLESRKEIDALKTRSRVANIPQDEMQTGSQTQMQMLANVLQQNIQQIQEMGQSNPTISQASQAAHVVSRNTGAGAVPPLAARTFEERQALAYQNRVNRGKGTNQQAQVVLGQKKEEFDQYINAMKQDLQKLSNRINLLEKSGSGVQQLEPLSNQVNHIETTVNSIINQFNQLKSAVLGLTNFQDSFSKEIMRRFEAMQNAGVPGFSILQ